MGGFGQTLRYFSKASKGIQLCANFRCTKVTNNTDTILDGEACLLSTEYFDSQSPSSHRVLFFTVVEFSVVLDILVKFVDFSRTFAFSLSKARVLFNLIFFYFLQYLLTCLCKLFKGLFGLSSFLKSRILLNLSFFLFLQYFLP